MVKSYFSRTVYANVIHCAKYVDGKIEILPDVIVNAPKALSAVEAIAYAKEENPEVTTVLDVESAGTVFKMDFETFIEHAIPVTGVKEDK